MLFSCEYGIKLLQYCLDSFFIAWLDPAYINYFKINSILLQQFSCP